MKMSRAFSQWQDLPYSLQRYSYWFLVLICRVWLWLTMKDAWFPLIRWKSKVNITYDSTTHEWRTFQIGIGTSSMCAFDLFKDFGLKKIDDDSFLNLAGYVSYWRVSEFLDFWTIIWKTIWPLFSTKMPSICFNFNQTS